MTGEQGINYLLKNYNFKTVLDIGSGSGVHANIFRKNDKEVIEVDLGKSFNVKRNKNYICEDYLNVNFDKSFDCIWICHVLEHQLNSNMFLKKVNNDLKDKGILAITVPPLKHNIVGGHVNLYNAGILLYQLVLAGFDCKDVSVKKYGYNISIILKKESIILPELTYDNGDLELLKEYFPIELRNNRLENFNGNINILNWRE